MEQHPVPQNVTTFQFRLVGDMTLKQFGYLAGGALLAYICYKLPLPLLLNWGLAIVAGLAGFGFAFVPIEERPMDVWVLSFFKSIYSPTLYTWSKAAPKPQAPAIKPASVTKPLPQPLPQPQSQTGITRKGDILQNIFQPSASMQNVSHAPGTVLAQNKARSMFDWLFDLFMPKPHLNGAAVAPVRASQVTLPSTMHTKMDFTAPPTVRPRGDIPKEKPLTQPIATDVQKQLTDLERERDKMEAELARLRVQNAPLQPKPTGTYVATPAARQGPSVRIITPDRAVKAGLPRLTTFANVVTGIVKDGDQNLLPGVLVTVKDKEGVPVRALKTNRLGQFAASTPLTNGTYFLEIEDPRLRYTFDRAQITLNGSVVPALEIFAKSQKEITRAKLEKALFGKQN